jgi:hypothetical protein
MLHRNIVLLAVSLAIAAPAVAQDASAPAPPAGMPSDWTPGSAVTTGTYGQPLLPEGNPLSNLFTPQPQYPTPQTQQNGPPPIPNDKITNPLGGLFTEQTQRGVAATPQQGTNNLIQGVFTGQNPFQTPQTPQNESGVSQYALPGYGQPKMEELEKAGIKFNVEDPNAPKDPYAYEKLPDPKPADDAADKKDKEKTDAAVKDKDKDAKDKDKDDKDKKKDGEGDKDKDKKADGDKDKDKDKDTTADADADKDKKDKDKDETPVVTGPYNPLRDAMSLINGGQSPAAIAVLAKVLKQNPGNAEAHYLAAVAWVYQREYEKAAAEYRTVLSLVPATQLAGLAVEGLKKIGQPAVLPNTPATKLPPLRQNSR